jgi:hypothetical protein
VSRTQKGGAGASAASLSVTISTSYLATFSGGRKFSSTQTSNLLFPVPIATRQAAGHTAKALVKL